MDHELTLKVQAYALITPSGIEVREALGQYLDRRCEVTCGSCDYYGEFREFEFNEEGEPNAS
jgi:hypothetical protein